MRKIILLIFFSILPINCFSVNYWTESKYASLKKEKVYARWNASFHAKPRYIYQKKHFPVLIINEHDVWREIFASCSEENSF